MTPFRSLDGAPPVWYNFKSYNMIKSRLRNDFSIPKDKQKENKESNIILVGNQGNN